MYFNRIFAWLLQRNETIFVKSSLLCEGALVNLHPNANFQFRTMRLSDLLTLLLKDIHF